MLAAKFSLSLKKPFLKPYLSGTVPNFGGHRFTLVKPLTFMNNSGEIFGANPDFLPAPERQVLVLCDQMDLSPGVLRLKTRGGTAGHNGLKSISQYIGEVFWPLYIGIGRPAPGNDIIPYVLGEPSPDERILINSALERVWEGIEILLQQGIDPAMGFLNQRQAHARTETREI